MVVGAFNQVQQSLRWFVDNFPRIADWRATLLRVMSFREALLGLEAVGGGAGRIESASTRPAAAARRPDAHPRRRPRRARPAAVEVGPASAC